MTVTLVARRGDHLERLRSELAASGGSAVAYVCRLTEPDAVDALVAALHAEHGTVDHLVSNAGRAIRRSLHLSYDRCTTSSARWQSTTSARCG